MSVEELSKYRELRRLVTEPVDWWGSTEVRGGGGPSPSTPIRSYFYGQESAPHSLDGSCSPPIGADLNAGVPSGWGCQVP